MAKEVFFSIIVPIYNVQDYLYDCLSSIRTSLDNFQDVEVLLINDGSTDSSSIIAKEFCMTNSLFKFYSKENGGLSDARNYGINKACGQYFVFIDSDDIIDSDFFSKVKNVLSIVSCDLLYIDFYKFNDSTDRTVKNNSNLNYQAISKSQLAKKPNFAWARIARSELYEGNLFPKGVIYEDVVTSSILTYRAKSIFYLKHKLYGYRKRPGSITTQSAEKQFDLFDSLQILNEKKESGLINACYYNTYFVNLIQSCLVSLARLNSRSVYIQKRNLVVYKYLNKLNFKQILFSSSSIRFKVLTLLSRNKLSISIIVSLIKIILVVKKEI